MGIDNAIGNSVHALDFHDLVELTKARAAQQNLRSKARRPFTDQAARAALLAPLLATEGCLTLGGSKSPRRSAEDAAGATDATAGGSVPAPTPPAAGGANVTPSSFVATDDSGFHANADTPVMIAPADLVANDAAPGGGAAEVVRVFGAQNGTVMMHGGAIHFTPQTGFSGTATFSYEARDAAGNLSTAQVEVMVGEMTGHNHDMPGDSGADASHDHDMAGMIHPDDPAKMAEHMAVMDLVPVSEATHVAVKNGSWFDPATWAGGEVPGEGARVVIPSGVTVAYDSESAVSLFTVRVDGVLDFATDKDTFMEVDTFVVSPAGRLVIGTQDNPVDEGVQTVIQFADNGPIDVSWDPMLLSRGLVSHGEVEIHGAEKDAFLRLAVDPMKGDTSLTLEAPPEGWQIGDKLVLTGTHLTYSAELAPMTPRDLTTEDEELTISRIEGNVIYFDTPLVYDHEGARSDLKAYVANYSRNVRFQTEGGDATPVHERGHVMFMHSDTIDVRYAEFQELGRTDKSERAFDVGDLAVVESDSNVKGRYAMHIHRAGVHDLDDPAMVVGNSVWGSPGWGFVHHDSNAILADNAAYDVYGAAFVAETGNETGRWTHNIAIKSIGNAGGPKWVDDVASGDMARTGVGFWFQGRLVDAIDNVAAGMPGGHGFVYMSRGGSDSLIPITPDTTDNGEILRYAEETLVNFAPITQFENNEALAVEHGLEIIKGGAEQFHDVHSVLDTFTAWEVRSGVHLQYTGHYTLIDMDLVATDRSGGAQAAYNGIEFGPHVVDTIVNGANIEGFATGVHAVRSTFNMNFPFDGNWGYVFIDVNITGAGTNFFNPDPSDIHLTSDDLVSGRFTYDSPNLDIINPLPEFHDWLIISGQKIDNIGEKETSPSWDPIRYDFFAVRGAMETEGYWTLPDGRMVTILDQYYSERATGEIEKVGVFVEWPRNLSEFETPPHYNGELDLDSEAPVGRTDFAVVDQNGVVDISVLLNDYDPEGDALSIDGMVQATHGLVTDNGDGTIRYAPDPNFVGVDEFWYWVDDGNGNYDKARVQVTVEI